jgi:MoaA/NifB/PqqE/SkfB family radical SAM enzyme
MTTSLHISGRVRDQPKIARPTRWVDVVPRPAAVQLQDAWLILNYACDAACPFCHIEGLKPLLKPLSRVLEEINEARQACLGERIGFSGGEPTLRKDLEEIFANASAAGFRKIHLYSHGRRFADENYALRLIRAGLSGAQISFHAGSDARNDEIMDLPRSEDTWRGIRILAQNGVEVTVNSVATKLNLRELPTLYTRVCSLDVPIAEFRITYPIIQRGALTNADLLLPLDEVVPQVERLIALNGRVPVRSELIPLCMLGPQFDKSVEWRFRHQSDFMIDREHFESERIWPRECISCKHRTYCTGLQERHVSLFGTPVTFGDTVGQPPDG